MTNYETSQESMAFSKQVAFDQLAEVHDACRQPNWDGEGAAAVDQDTLRNARLFIEALPLGFAVPTISAEPDGHIDLEWYREPRRILSVSVAPEGMLYWAALFGIEDPRGSCPFQGEVPVTILHWIARLCA